MKRVVIQYKLKPEHAERNIELIHAVYDELERTQPDGLGHAVLQLADGVTFIHIAEETKRLPAPSSGSEASSASRPGSESGARSRPPSNPPAKSGRIGYSRPQRLHRSPEHDRQHPGSAAQLRNPGCSEDIERSPQENDERSDRSRGDPE